MTSSIRARASAIIVLPLLVLAGCASVSYEFDYGFDSSDGRGAWQEVDHDSATILLQDDGTFEAELPASLCGEPMPSYLANVDWKERKFLSGEWRTFEHSSYSGYLAPTEDCPFIPIYFQRDSTGGQSMIIYLVADEDADEENIMRFIRADRDD